MDEKTLLKIKELAETFKKVALREEAFRSKQKSKVDLFIAVGQRMAYERFGDVIETILMDMKGELK